MEFRDNYLNSMQELIDNIKNNKYMTSYLEEDKKVLIRMLYELYHKFVCFGYEMKKQQIEGNYYRDFFPCSHDYNRYLHYITPIMYDKYYLKVVSVIEEFVKNQGEIIPKYLYNLTTFKGEWIVDTLEYLDENMIPSEKKLRLPNYYVISSTIADLSVYKQMFSREENAKRFEETEYPIFEWIKANRKDNKGYTFYKNGFSHKMRNVCHYIQLCLTDGDEFTIADISYHCGYCLQESRELLEEVQRFEYYKEKIIKLSEDKYMFHKLENC